MPRNKRNGPLIKNPTLDQRKLALAVVQALQLWSNPQYQAFLSRGGTRRLERDWFARFLGSWSVARNLKKAKQQRVMRYLNTTFRSALKQGNWRSCVDEAARHIQKKKWSSRRCLPLSLVSKIGFFLHPSKLVPLDRFSVRGLQAFRAGEDFPKVRKDCYQAYLQKFDEEFGRVEPLLKSALAQPWAIGLAKHLQCPRRDLKSVAMRRKLFDNYLMHFAGFRK